MCAHALFLLFIAFQEVLHSFPRVSFVEDNVRFRNSHKEDSICYNYIKIADNLEDFLGYDHTSSSHYEQWSLYNRTFPFIVKLSYYLYIDKWVFEGSPKGEKVSLITFVYSKCHFFGLFYRVNLYPNYQVIQLLSKVKKIHKYIKRNFISNNNCPLNVGN